MGKRTLIRLRKALRNRRLLYALSTVALSVTFVLGMAGTALAAEEETPKLDYEFRWWSFLICVVLVIGFYILLYAVSFKEFKQVINDHFGPKK
jgi:uncharacterized membrane protein